MPEGLDETTAVCMFHHIDSAEAAVRSLFALGLAASQIAVVGDARTELSGSTSTATLQSMRVPDDDLQVLMDGLRDGGTIVAVRASPEHGDAVDRIFREHSAELIDEKVFETNVDAATSTKPVNPATSNFDTNERL